MKIVLRLGRIDDIRSFGILAFWNGLEYHNFDFSALIGNHFCTNLGQIRISDPDVLGERSCTDGVDNCYHAQFTYVRYGMGLLGTQVISK